MLYIMHYNYDVVVSKCLLLSLPAAVRTVLFADAVYRLNEYCTNPVLCDFLKLLFTPMCLQQM